MRATTTLDSPKVKETLDHLLRDADENDPRVMSRVFPDYERRGPNPDPGALAELFREAYLPVPADVGRLLYVLARSIRAQTIVEFGTSFGISTIFLAAAVRDNGSGRIISTELHPDKVRKARQNIEDAGLGDLVEVREGDALVTLQDVPGPIDLVLLDGWKDLYLPMLRQLEPKLRPGAVIVADDLDIAPEDLKTYIDYVRDPASGYVSMAIENGDKLEVSCWHGPAGA